MVRRVIALVLTGVGLYFVWPALVEVFGSWDDLSKIKPWWFAVMVVFEFASLLSMWVLIALSTSSKDLLLVATAQLMGGAVTSIVPAGGLAGGPVQFSYMVRGGEDPGRTASGLTAAGLVTTTALFGLAGLCVPLMLRVGGIDARLERAAWLGLGAFVVLFLLGVLAMTLDGPLRAFGRAAQWIVNHVRRKKQPVEHLDDEFVAQRDRVRATLGKRWPWALLAAVCKWAFDYFALVAAVAATGAPVHTVPVLLAYIAAQVLGMIPITPGGLGFVEAGLAATLVWAGVPSGNATLATLAYRLVSYWLPLLLGIVAVVIYRARYPERVAAATAPASAPS